MNGEMQWVSLSVGFLSDMKIKRIRKLPDGDKIILVWIGIICLAAKTNDKGFIYLDKETPYDEELLIAEFDVSIELLRLAMSVFKKYGMLSVDDGGMIFVSNYLKYNEKADKLSDYREKARLRVAAFRDRQNALASKEESTKEEIDYSNSNNNNTGKVLHNVTVTLQDKSNSNLTIADIGETTQIRQPISPIPFSALTILREERRSQEAIDWVSKQKALVTQLIKAFPQGSGANNVYSELAGCYEQDPSIANETQLMLEAASKWRQVKEFIIKKTKSDKFPTYSLAGWIKVCGWRQAVDFLKEEKAKASRVTNATW